MANKEPVEQSRARAADVQIAGRRRSEANANFGTHLNLASHRLHRFSQIPVGEAVCFPWDANSVPYRKRYSIKILPARRRTCRSCGRLTLATRELWSSNERTFSTTSNPTFVIFRVRNHFKISQRRRSIGKSRTSAT